MRRLYTPPKNWALFNRLSSMQTYEKIMKNNVDLELSPNPIDISIQKTLNTSRSAIFASSLFLDWGENYSKHPKHLSCLVRLE